VADPATRTRTRARPDPRKLALTCAGWALTCAGSRMPLTR